jgi:hypothetical protein
MTSLMEKLAELKQIGEMSLSHKSDEEIAHSMGEGFTPFKIASARKAMGIFHREMLDITKQYKKAAFSDGSNRLDFAISRECISSLGLNPNRQVEFTGKVEGKNLVLRIRNV